MYSNKQDDVVKLINEGKTYKEISRILGINKGTVSWYAVRAGLKKVVHRPIEDYLTKNSLYRGGSTSFKARLTRKGLLRENCYICNLSTKWQGKNLTLQLDHINGDNLDNRIENLRLLCPNCHTQTDTYCRGKKLPL